MYKHCKRVKNFPFHKHYDKHSFHSLGKPAYPSSSDNHLYHVLNRRGRETQLIAKIIIADNESSIKHEINALLHANNLGISLPIVDFLECKDNSGIQYIVLMEYIPGLTLSTYLLENHITGYTQIPKDIRIEVHNVFEKLYNGGIDYKYKLGDNIILTSNKIYIVNYQGAQVTDNIIPPGQRNYSVEFSL